MYVDVDVADGCDDYVCVACVVVVYACETDGGVYIVVVCALCVSLVLLLYHRWCCC